MFATLTGELGVPFYERIDAPATAQQKAVLKAASPDQLGIRDLGGEKIGATLTAAPGNGAAFGGIKVVAENGWFAARPSGTEDVYKIYAESFLSVEHLHRVQQEAQQAIGGLFAAAG
jgi:phosphoglucomutase